MQPSHLSSLWHCVYKKTKISFLWSEKRWKNIGNMQGDDQFVHSFTLLPKELRVKMFFPNLLFVNCSLLVWWNVVVCTSRVCQHHSVPCVTGTQHCAVAMFHWEYNSVEWQAKMWGWYNVIPFARLYSLPCTAHKWLILPITLAEHHSDHWQSAKRI